MHCLTLNTLAAAATHTAAKAQAAAPWHESLVTATVDLSIVVIVAGMIICILRLVRGPHLADRALAVDVLAVQLIGLTILLTMSYKTLVFFDGIMVLSLLGFAGTVAMAQYIGRPHTNAPGLPEPDTE